VPARAAGTGTGCCAGAMVPSPLGKDGGGRAARTARAAVLSPRPRGSFVRDEADSPSP